MIIDGNCRLNGRLNWSVMRASRASLFVSSARPYLAEGGPPVALLCSGRERALEEK